MLNLDETVQKTQLTAQLNEYVLLRARLIEV